MRSNVVFSYITTSVWAICVVAMSGALLVGGSVPVNAEENSEVHLLAKDGALKISGKIVQIKGGQYHIQTTVFGVMKLDLTKFDCIGSACQSAEQIAPVRVPISAPVKGKPAPEPRKTTIVLSAAGSQTERLLSLIAKAEATELGYDTVQLGARIRPPEPPTKMTMGQIKRWVHNTPRQPHAIGRYQFIPKTFNMLQRRLRLPDSTIFSPAVQDMMALELLNDAGYRGFLSGRKSSKAFMDSLALIWAGLPMETGRSKYHGYAGNKATISRAYFTSNMADIFHN